MAILAEAGLGKSRLIAETRRLLPANVTWAEGRALSFTAGMSYWLAREIRRPNWGEADLLKRDPVWHAGLAANPTNAPITFMLDGRQFVVVGAGDSLYAFTLAR